MKQNISCIASYPNHKVASWIGATCCSILPNVHQTWTYFEPYFESSLKNTGRFIALNPSDTLLDLCNYTHYLSEESITWKCQSNQWRWGTPRISDQDMLGLLSHVLYTSRLETCHLILLLLIPIMKSSFYPVIMCRKMISVGPEWDKDVPSAHGTSCHSF